ncbi:hypothetical protein PRZ48_000490 [Zasmidium cellare]|uniref:Uncharacterized protein n=1 Tax=Zasmidium cellare TaxID=395010 RepID=A0ABR0EYM5_ZASCE|nr:hypothetical protein PRZ48_000490 [Zasmidium cellare]
MGRSSYPAPPRIGAAKIKRMTKGDKEELRLRRMHELNLISQLEKDRLRDKIHSDAEIFEKDRQKLLDHEKAVKYLKRESKMLLAYKKFGSTVLSSPQKEKLEDPEWHAPKHLFRVASDISSGKYHSTKGLDSKDVHVPGVSCVKHDGRGLGKGIYHIADSLAEERDIIDKLGHRLMWNNRNSDPFLSWTPSMLFVLVLGTAREAKGEKKIHITSIDTDQADYGKIVRPKYKVERADDQSIALDLNNGTVTRDGPTKFYFAERLLRITNARCWNKWKPGQVVKLTNNWYTGEWLSHGIVLSERNSYRANLLDLLDDELYDYHDQLVTEENEDMRSLYHRCVRARSIAFSIHDEAQLLTTEELQKANRHAARFMVSGQGKKKEDELSKLVPPLHIFLSLLGLKKRVRKDHLFMQWIRDHYTAADIASCGYEKTTKIANNLPEVMETVHLARDACIALEIPEIPAIPVWLADPDFDFNGQWVHEFPKEVEIQGSRAGKPKLGKMPNFDKDGMALSVVVDKDGWVVEREWKSDYLKEMAVQVGDGDGDEDMEADDEVNGVGVEMEVEKTPSEEQAGSADVDIEDGAMEEDSAETLEGQGGLMDIATQNSTEGEGEEPGTVVDVDVEAVELISGEQKGSTDGDGDEEMAEAAEEDLSTDDTQALDVPRDEDEWSVSAEEEDVSGDEADLMTASSQKQKPVEAEMETEEEMALV